MKKFTLSLLVAFFSVALVAQEHMTFKSVSMEKNINEFVSALKSKGMVISKYDATLGNQTTRLMTGQFAGIEDCSLIILATPSTKKVCKVSASTPNSKSWSSVLSEYKSLKESLESKYEGCEIKTYAFFSDPYDLGDGYELQALSKDKCTYATYITTPQGSIMLKITSASYNEAYVNIVYEDAINWKEFSSARKASIEDDL